MYDPAGKAVYPEVKVNCPYAVRVSISDLNIRKGPGTNYAKTGQHTGKGVFTIVEEADGEGATRWGLLKAYAGKRNGWISLILPRNCKRCGSVVSGRASTYWMVQIEQ